MRHSILLFTFLAVSVHAFSQAPVDELLYICRDHLGSITHVVSSEGEDLQELSYDPWGRPRDPDTHTLYASSEQPVPVLGRGYTGHEHLHQFNLINMNARLYDPALGRFLMADPVITDAGWGQGYNRYAYALGNPLKYVDRTGKSVSAVIFGIGVAVAALTSAYFTTASVTGYYNIARWDFRKTSTWLGLFGGAAIGVVGSFTGYQLALAMPAFSFLTTTMVTSVIASAGSLGIQAQASADNRTAYNPSFSISFGFGSVDILSGKFHSFGSRTGLAETFGYASGTFGVLVDLGNAFYGSYNFFKLLKSPAFLFANNKKPKWTVLLKDAFEGNNLWRNLSKKLFSRHKKVSKPESENKIVQVVDQFSEEEEWQTFLEEEDGPEFIDKADGSGSDMETRYTITTTQLNGFVEEITVPYRVKKGTPISVKPIDDDFPSYSDSNSSGFEEGPIIPYVGSSESDNPPI